MDNRKTNSKATSARNYAQKRPPSKAATSNTHTPQASKQKKPMQPAQKASHGSPANKTVNRKPPAKAVAKKATANVQRDLRPQPAKMPQPQNQKPRPKTKKPQKKISKKKLVIAICRYIEKHIAVVIPVVIVCLTALFLLFRGSPVIINDMGNELKWHSREQKTIREVLKNKGYILTEKDDSEPPLDSVFTKDVKQIEVKRYAKVTVSKGGIKKEIEVNGGKVIDAINAANIELTENDVTEPKLTDYVKDGMEIFVSAYQCFTKINGQLYYFNEEGEVEKNGIVGNEEEGYCLAGEDGTIDETFRGAVEKDNEWYLVFGGVARKAETEFDKTLYRAFKELEKCTTDDMTDEEKLSACFKYIQTNFKEYNPRIPHSTEMDWPIVYANDVFVDRGGNCYSFAMAFAFMAVAIGYDDVYGCNSGGHGWAEIDNLVYDPEWGIHYDQHSYFALSYDEPVDQHYAAAISSNQVWMHIKIDESGLNGVNE